MKFVWCVAITFSLLAPALGQVPSSEEPGHVSSRFSEPQQPVSVASGTVRLPATPVPSAADHLGIRLERVVIVGGTVYSTTRLEKLYADLIGKTVPLSSIYALAQAITKLYGDDGYVLSRAVVPPQDIDPKHATVTIQISEAYIDRVDWPASFSKYRDLFSGYARKITAERPSNVNTVMRYLLLAGELPGLAVLSTFVASPTNPQASTLVVTATEKPVAASAQLDNRGTEARGPWEYVLSATFNNLRHQHESLTATLAGATDWHELTYAAFNYRQVLTDEGLSVFSDLSYSAGLPGTAALKAVQFTSTSFEVDAGLTLALVRTRDTKVTLSALAFASNNEGTMLGAPSSDDRLRGLRIKADLEHEDDLKGQTTANFTLSHGFEGLGSSMNGSPLLSRANGRVDFTTLEGTVARTQPLGRRLSIMTAAEGQYALTPLLSPEECGYGGRDFGRAFDPSEITGDSCLLLSGELRLDPEIPSSAFDQTQLYSFLDYGEVFRIAPSSGTPTHDAGASAGLGLRLAKAGYSADLAAAKPIFGRSDRDWRLFLTAKASY